MGITSDKRATGHESRCEYMTGALCSLALYIQPEFITAALFYHVPCTVLIKRFTDVLTCLTTNYKMHTPSSEHFLSSFVFK